MGTRMSVPVRLCMHLHVCVHSLTYVGVSVNLRARRGVNIHPSVPVCVCVSLHAPCQHELAHMCTLGYRNAQGYRGMLA